jgi:hypothetical protein
MVTVSGGMANDGHWRFQIKPTRQSRIEWRAIEARKHHVSEEVLPAVQIMSFVSSPGSFSNQIPLNDGPSRFILTLERKSSGAVIE